MAVVVVTVINVIVLLAGRRHRQCGHHHCYGCCCRCVPGKVVVMTAIDMIVKLGRSTMSCVCSE